MIVTILVGYTLQELQVMYGWFEVYLSNLDTGVDNVPIPSLSSMEAHSVSGGTLLNITGCHPESPWGIERTFHSSSSLTMYKMTAICSPCTDFLSYL